MPNQAKPESLLKLQTLATEAVLPASRKLDAMTSRQIVALMHREDQRAVKAVGQALAAVARAVDVIAERWRRGGRLIYVGAGTSGRLGVLDASECPPTFHVPASRIRGVIAGGRKALVAASEDAEDHAAQGRRDLERIAVGASDVVVGIAASGRTPYTLGALQYARKRGAATIAVACTHNSPLARAAEIAIEAVTGAEVVSGSTRLKAGTAQKLVLNMLSTAAMARVGRVYGPWMAEVRASNAKLRVRAARILAQAAGLEFKTAERKLKQAGGDLKLALVAELGRVSLKESRARLGRAEGNLRQALGPVPRTTG